MLFFNCRFTARSNPLFISRLKLFLPPDAESWDGTGCGVVMAHTIFRVRVPKSLSIISTDQHATFEVIEAQFSTIKFSQQRVFAPTGFHRVCCLPFTRITHHFSVHIRIRHLLIRLGRSRITVKRRIIDMDGEFTSNIFLIKMKIAQFSSRFFFAAVDIFITFLWHKKRWKASWGERGGWMGKLF